VLNAGCDLFTSGGTIDSAASVQELSASLFEFQKSGFLCDTVIVADDGRVKAHSVVLAAVSPVFRHVLQSSSQPLEHTVVLPGMQLAAVSVIIEFVYTGKITIAKDSMNIMHAINDLGIKLHINRYLFHRYLFHITAVLMTLAPKFMLQFVKLSFLPGCMQCRHGLAMRKLSVCPSICQTR